VNTTAAHPTEFRSTSNLTANPETPSDTIGHPNGQSPDRPNQRPPSAESIGVNFLKLDEMCDRYILFVFNRCGRKYGTTARALGIGRTSLYRYMKNLALENESESRNHVQGDFDSDCSWNINYIPTIG
jgi:DNA-binding NtrC family response regulator